VRERGRELPLKELGGRDVFTCPTIACSRSPRAFGGCQRLDAIARPALDFAREWEYQFDSPMRASAEPAQRRPQPRPAPPRRS
jgi:hypothetical protein